MTGLRVALLTYSTKPRGGVVHTLALAEALSRAGCRVDVWTLARGGDTAFYRSVDAAVSVHAVPLPDLDCESVGDRVIRSIAVLGGAFDRSGYDIVHAQDCISANASLPCVRTIHHLDVFTTPALAACHERAVVEPVALICVSEAVAAEVRDGWRRVPTVIPNGVDSARFDAAAAPGGVAARDRWNGRLGKYVLALGGIEPRKGSLDLLEAYALLRRRMPDVRLVFGGGETLFDYRDYRAAFDARAAELGVDVEVLGLVPDDTLPALVAGASALGFVSAMEGFGLAAMEALAAGVPVVARDLPVLREVFGSTLRYAVDPSSIAAQLEAVLRNQPNPSSGRDLAATYTWDRAAAAHLTSYSQLMERAT